MGHHGRDKEKKEVIDCLLSKGPQERAEAAMVNEYINNGYTWHTGMHVTEQPEGPAAPPDILQMDKMQHNVALLLFSKKHTN